MPFSHGHGAPSPRPRLYVIVDATVPGGLSSAAQALGPESAAADIAAVLLHLPAEADANNVVAAAKTLAGPVQRRGAALLLDSHARLAGEGDADGAHLTGIEALKAALPVLKPDRIAGVGGLATRHAAMTAGELGADYVMFGEPAPDGRRPAFSAIRERVAWWAEIFEPPCVGFAADLDELAALAAAGADFVALADVVWNHAAGPAAALVAATERLRAVELA